MSQSQAKLTGIKARDCHPRGRWVPRRIEVREAPPPFGDEVRYFQMGYSQPTQWRLRRELTKWSYYLNLF